MAHQTHTPGSSPVDLRALWGLNGDTMDYAERAYRAWLQRAESVQATAMDYWNTEMQKGIEAMSEIAKCQTAVEAFGVQTRFATEAVQDFFSEGQKVMDRLAQASWMTPAGESEATTSAPTTRRSSRRRS